MRLTLIPLLVIPFAIGCDEELVVKPLDRIEGTEEGDCSDGADNDADTLFDCDDDGCAGAPA